MGGPPAAPDWLCRLAPGAAEITRLVIAEAPIDALSLAAIEGLRPDSLYIATGGRIGDDNQNLRSKA